MFNAPSLNSHRRPVASKDLSQFETMEVVVGGMKGMPRKKIVKARVAWEQPKAKLLNETVIRRKGESETRLPLLDEVAAVNAARNRDIALMHAPKGGFALVEAGAVLFQGSEAECYTVLNKKLENGEYLIPSLPTRLIKSEGWEVSFDEDNGPTMWEAQLL